MNSITTRVWIAGASGRLGSALSHRFGGNTAYKLVTSDRDVAVEDVSVVGRFADINHPDVIINCAGLTDVQACEENPEEAYKTHRRKIHSDLDRRRIRRRRGQGFL